MTSKTPAADKSGGGAPRTEYMRYCGSATIRGDPKSKTDGLSGSLPLTEDDLQAAGVSPGDKVNLVVRHDGETVQATREVHSTGETITLPVEYRQELGLELEDVVEYWIDLVEKREAEDEGGESEETQKPAGEITKDADEAKLAVLFLGEDTYHFVESRDAEETVCGIGLDGREYRMGPEPGGLLDPCKNCAIRSSGDISNEELVDWLGAEVGFEKSDGPPSYLKKDQLIALRDYILDQKDRIKELKEQLGEVEDETHGDDMWAEDAKYSLKIAGRFDGEQIITADTQAGALANAVEALMERHDLDEALELPFVPGKKNALVNDRPEHPDGRPMGRKREIAGGRYYVNTEPMREMKMRYLRDMAGKVGAFIEFRNGWEE